MRSALYECTVTHTRFSPRRHHFAYRTFAFCLDLEEIDTLVQRIPWLSRNRFNLYAFHDRDHATIRDVLRDRGYADAARIELITNLRMAGYVFNPVSFYFAFDEAGNPLVAVAEVNNTFRERKLYVVDVDEHSRFEAEHRKDFYISPFVALDATLRLKLPLPGERLAIVIESLQDGECVVRASMTGSRQPLTSARLAWFAIKYPLLTVKVIAAIHWQALLLFLKRVPFFRKQHTPPQPVEVR